MQQVTGRYMPVHAARAILGISKPTMARLLREKRLSVRAHPLDKRVKLVLRSQVEALKKQTEE